MDKKRILDIFSIIDSNLQSEAELLIYGSGAFILLDEDDRTSLDIDVAAAYSKVNFVDFQKAVEKAGLEINPAFETDDEHIEWISQIRLCLAHPDSTDTLTLWTGFKLTVKTLSPPDLIASKLIRYDEIDQSDIRYLIFQMSVPFDDIEMAVQRLPNTFKLDINLQENLLNLKQDIELWKAMN